MKGLKFRTRTAPLRAGSLEWVQVKGWGRSGPSLRNDPYGNSPVGWIPRYVLEEEFGIDCSPLDHPGDLKKQGTVWFSKEQSENIHAHHLFEAESAE